MDKGINDDKLLLICAPPEPDCNEPEINQKEETTTTVKFNVSKCTESYKIIKG
jgi:hypothetical protein